MTENRRTDFCTTCRKETAYTLHREPVTYTIKGKDYPFYLTTATCNVCGMHMDIPGLIDLNNREIDTQYREAEDLISIADIEKLMEIYQLGKAPLSLALGFGEITISRYLSGQMPSKEYSDIMRRALDDPDYMETLLERNRDKIADTAYKKAAAAIRSLKDDFHLSRKLAEVISYIFDQLHEVTPLMLQKLLYYIQGIFMVNNGGASLFPEDCQAWVHGPVYPDVYNLFKTFHYNPIEDARFALLQDKAALLSEHEKKNIDLVLNTFGMYGGKVLERITHNEDPWKDARSGYADCEPSHVIIGKEAICAYFMRVNQNCRLDSEKNIAKYIAGMLQ